MKYKNEQGNWVSIALPSLDSMPVGTIVDYDGTDIPVGWEETNDYSTTEINTGKKWINGKPIYRKVISVSNTTISTSTSIPTNITNLETLVKLKGVFINGTTNKMVYPLVFMDGSSLEVLQCILGNDNNIKFVGNSQWGSAATRTHTFVIEYTKTTD